MTVDWTTGLEGLAYPQAAATPGLYTKYPAETFDISIDWVAQGLPASDTIATSVWVADTGITLATESFTATTTTMWVSGGTGGWLYHVTNTITTTGGRTFYMILYIKVKQTPDQFGGTGP